MNSYYEANEISGHYQPRQFEYHPVDENLMVFGTLKGNVCKINLNSQEIVFLGNYGLNNIDAVLGLCWLRTQPSKFIVGTSSGKLTCGDVRNEFGMTRDGEAFVKQYPSFNHLTSVHVNSTNSYLLVRWEP
jgi:hypothetical protein